MQTNYPQERYAIIIWLLRSLVKDNNEITKLTAPFS